MKYKYCSDCGRRMKIRRYKYVYCPICGKMMRNISKTKNYAYYICNKCNSNILYGYPPIEIVGIINFDTKKEWRIA